MDMEKIITGLKCCCEHIEGMSCVNCPYDNDDMASDCSSELAYDVLSLLKEQEKKEIKLHKKHVLTLKRNDEFTMRKLYESICEKLLDEGEMIITRTDDHEKVEFVFYVAGE